MHTAFRRIEVNKEKESMWKEADVSEGEIQPTGIRLEGLRNTTKHFS